MMMQFAKSLLANYIFLPINPKDVIMIVFLLFFSPRYYTEFNGTVELGEKIFDNNGSIVAARATKMVWHLTMNSSVSQSLIT